MKTLPIRFVPIALLFASAFAVLGAHGWLALWLFEGLRATPASAALASVTASLIVWLVCGVFVLPRLPRLCGNGTGADAAFAVVLAALVVVMLRAFAEAWLGVVVTGLPLSHMAAAIAVVGGAAAGLLRRGPSRRFLPPQPAGSVVAMNAARRAS